MFLKKTCFFFQVIVTALWYTERKQNLAQMLIGPTLLFRTDPQGFALTV